MEDTKKTVLAGNGEKDVPRAVYDGVLTIDVDAQVESMTTQKEQTEAMGNRPWLILRH